MDKAYLKLQPSEVAITQSASHIYAAYIVAGKVAEGDEDAWMERSIKEAIRIAESRDPDIGLFRLGVVTPQQGGAGRRSGGGGRSLPAAGPGRSIRRITRSSPRCNGDC